MRSILRIVGTVGAIVCVALVLLASGVLRRSRPDVGQVRARIAAKSPVLRSAPLATCTGADAGPQLKFDHKTVKFNVSNGDSWTLWDETYPEGWPNWLGLPRYTYFVTRDGGLAGDPQDALGEPHAYLVKADGPALVRAITAQVPVDPKRADRYRAPLVSHRTERQLASNMVDMSDVTVDSFIYHRVDGGRQIEFKFESSPAFDGWVVMRIGNRRMVQGTPLQP